MLLIEATEINNRFSMKFAIKGGIGNLQITSLNNWLFNMGSFYEIESNLGGIDGAVVRQPMKT